MSKVEKWQINKRTTEQSAIHMSNSDFDRLVEEALAQDFSGWDFSWLYGRWYEEEPPWNYEEIVAKEITGVGSLLDMGLGATQDNLIPGGCLI